jgi:hypothetical protein
LESEAGLSLSAGAAGTGRSRESSLFGLTTAPGRVPEQAAKKAKAANTHTLKAFIFFLYFSAKHVNIATDINPRIAI